MRPARLSTLCALILASTAGCATYGPVPSIQEEWNSYAPDHRDKSSISILILGDAGKAGPSLDQVSTQARGVCQALGCDLAVVLGDNFYQDGVVSTEDPLWKSTFITPWAPMADGDMRFWAIMGNHDWRANRAGAEAQITFTHSPQNPQGLWAMPDLNYKIPGLPSWLNIHLFDSMSEVIAGKHSTYLEHLAQAEKAEGWLIIGAHHFAMSGGFHGKLSFIERHDRRMERAIRPMQDKVDLFLSGHDHHQELLYNGHYAQVIQGNSSKYRDTYKTRHHKHQLWIRPQGDEAEGAPPPSGFSRMVATPEHLQITYYDQAGTALYTAQITRDEGGLVVGEAK